MRFTGDVFSLITACVTICSAGGLVLRTPPIAAAAVARFLDYVRSHDDAWVCQRQARSTAL